MSATGLRISDPSLVSYRHLVGYSRSPGNLACLVTRSIGECRMSLWSAMVVNFQAHGSGGGRSAVGGVARITGWSDARSTSGPRTTDPLDANYRHGDQ